MLQLSIVVLTFIGLVYLRKGFLVCFDVCLIFAIPAFENDQHSRPALSARSLAKTQLHPSKRVGCSNTAFQNCPSVLFDVFLGLLLLLSHFHADVKLVLGLTAKQPGLVHRTGCSAHPAPVLC